MKEFASFFNSLDPKAYFAILFIIAVLIIAGTAIIRDVIKMIFKIFLHYGPRKKS